MAVTEANFKLYQCATWAEGSTHGGAISATEITSGVDQGIFDDVTEDERVAGDDEYRKVFFKNCSPNDSVSIKAYISTQYTAANQKVHICLGTDSGVQTTAGEGADGTYTQPTTLEPGLDLGTLAADASKAIWIKRHVEAGGNGITADTFALTFGMY